MLMAAISIVCANPECTISFSDAPAILFLNESLGRILKSVPNLPLSDFSTESIIK